MNEPQKKYLTTKERICFTVGAFGRSGIYTLMSMFTLVFFQNGAGLSLCDQLLSVQRRYGNIDGDTASSDFFSIK